MDILFWLLFLGSERGKKNITTYNNFDIQNSMHEIDIISLSLSLMWDFLMYSKHIWKNSYFKNTVSLNLK